MSSNKFLFKKFISKLNEAAELGIECHFIFWFDLLFIFMISNPCLNSLIFLV